MKHMTRRPANPWPIHGITAADRVTNVSISEKIRGCEAKKSQNLWTVGNKFLTLQTHSKRKTIGIWCNGNTTDSGPVIPGSSPGIPTTSFLNDGNISLRLGYGVMVTLQILVLSFLVRVRVSQQQRRATEHQACLRAFILTVSVPPHRFVYLCNSSPPRIGEGRGRG